MTNVAKLPPTIRQGILNLAGTTPEARRVAERILEQDREKHHCFWGKTVGFHNHLSHHVLAAYDLGAPAALLQKIYDQEAAGQSDIKSWERRSGTVEAAQEIVTIENWTTFLGNERYYPNYLEFFTKKIADLGGADVLEKYVFSPAANGNEAYMLLRFVGGAVHPLIQTGYAVEFGSDAMLAQALAQAAVHDAFYPEIFDFGPPSPLRTLDYKSGTSTHRQPHKGHSLLSILRQAYDSDIMKPVMPYNPDALLSARFKSALEDGTRGKEIRRLSALWQIDTSRGQTEFDEKIEELLWTTTLLLVGSGKRGRKPRLDFFLMHMLNASLFVPSLLQAIPTTESKAAFLRAIPPVLLMYLTVRGRPRVDADLAMSYTEFPRPPNTKVPEPSADAIGDPRDPKEHNAWGDIVADAIHAPDAHTPKAIRALYYASRMYGRTPSGQVIGAFDTEGRETHPGIAKVDGTLFTRTAGVVMDALGCSNQEIAIKFEHDLGASWEVRVTVEVDKDGAYMWKTKLPTSNPVIKVAKGGAPVEDAHSSRGEIEGKKKKVSHMLFLPGVFERYLKGEVGSEARKTELAVFNVEKSEPAGKLRLKSGRSADSNASNSKTRAQVMTMKEIPAMRMAV